MAITCRNLPHDHEYQVWHSVAAIRERLRAWRERLPRGLVVELTQILDAEEPSVELYLDADGDGWAERIVNCIWIRPRTFQSCAETGTSRLTAVLFHELIHVADGAELDAEFFENLLFAKGEGGTAPDAEDWRKFLARGCAGRWLRLDPDTGEPMYESDA
jgi:hypothetical protein